MALPCSPGGWAIAAWPWAYETSEQIHLPRLVVPAKGFFHSAKENDGLAGGCRSATAADKTVLHSISIVWLGLLALPNIAEQQPVGRNHESTDLGAASRCMKDLWVHGGGQSLPIHRAEDEGAHVTPFALRNVRHATLIAGAHRIIYAERSADVMIAMRFVQGIAS